MIKQLIKSGFLIGFLGLLVGLTNAQDRELRLRQLDVLRYDFAITVNDQSDEIKGVANIQFLVKQPNPLIAFDLKSVGSDRKGMQVTSILDVEQQALTFEHQDDLLKIELQLQPQVQDTLSLTIIYEGVPANGLVISQNKFGDRTFFGDNWPNRAHHWLPTVDHPADKAFVGWSITAPNHYQVVANGSLVEETNLGEDLRLTRWESGVPLPTKVMVFGAARFAVDYLGQIAGIPVSTWVYPQNRDAGFYDFSIAGDILQFYIDLIGPYPYRKLANVQSKTMFGGMENASNIFYKESSVSGNQREARLIAHEIVHQWFGNSATESDWSNLWLSEGFATYLTNIYVEQTEGLEAAQNLLKQQRVKVITFARKRFTPVVDVTATGNFMQLLNANSYQKGGWTLHMLRTKIGDEAFIDGIRKYYTQYQFSNATTADFQRVMEEVCGESLQEFFQQWLYHPGHPVLEVKWSYQEGQLSIQFIQQQKEEFKFPIEVEIVTADNTVLHKTHNIDRQQSTFTLPLDAPPSAITLDPDTKLLFQYNLTEIQ